MLQVVFAGNNTFPTYARLLNQAIHATFPKILTESIPLKDLYYDQKELFKILRNSRVPKNVLRIFEKSQHVRHIFLFFEHQNNHQEFLK